MAIPVLHSDQQDLSRSVGNAILYQNEVPLITATQIQNATNVAGLKTDVDNVAVHSDMIGLKPAIKRALDIGLADTSLSDSNVQAATSAATLAANTYASASKIGPPDLL